MPVCGFVIRFDGLCMNRTAAKSLIGLGKKKELEIVGKWSKFPTITKNPKLTRNVFMVLHKTDINGC